MKLSSHIKKKAQAKPKNSSHGHGGARPGAGQPKALFDLEEVEKLGVLQCTDADLAGHFRVDAKTIQRHRENDPEFAAALERGKASGRVSLRRMQLVAAQSGNPAMLIWLGKITLQQREQVEVIERPSAVRYGWVKPKKEAEEPAQSMPVDSDPSELVDPLKVQ